MPVAGVEEELRALDRRVELARGVEVSSSAHSSSSMMWICTGTASGHGPPNSSGGKQLWNSTAPFAPGLVWASICAGMAPSENPA